MSNLRSFEELECWKACRGLRLFVTKEILPAIPPEERFRLADQLIRAARSATANIAEGYGRFHHIDNAKFCSNARGSAWEVLDHLIVARDEGMISDAQLADGREMVETAVKLLSGYMSYLKRAAAGTKQPTARNQQPTTDNQ